MTARKMTLRPAGSEPKRRGRPSKVEAQPKHRRAKRLRCWLDWMR